MLRRGCCCCLSVTGFLASVFLLSRPRASTEVFFVANGGYGKGQSPAESKALAVPF